MFKAILTISFVQILGVCVQFIKTKVAAVYLGPAGIGVVGAIDQLAQTIAFILSLGLTDSATKFLSKAHSENPEKFKASYAGFLKLLFFLSLTGSVIVIGISYLKPNIFGDEITSYNSYLILALLAVPAYVLGLFFARTLAAAREYRASSILGLFGNALTTVGVTIGAITVGITGFYLGNLLSGVLLTVASMIFLSKRFGLNPLESTGENWLEINRSSDIVYFSAIFYFVSIANSVSYFFARYIVLKDFGEVEAGFLHAAFVISLVIGLILNPAVKLYFTPIVNRNVEKRVKFKQAVEFQRKIIILLLLTALPIVLFPQILLTLLFSEKFIFAAGAVFYFVIAQFIFQAAYINLSLLVGLDDLKSYAAVYIFGQVLFAFLCFRLVPYYNINGVAYGLAVSGLFMLSATFVRLIRNHGFRVSLNLYLLLFYALAVLYLAGSAFQQMAEELSLFGLLIRMGGFLLITISLFFFLDKSEKISLYKIGERNFSRLMRKA